MPDPTPDAGIDTIVAALNRQANDQRRSVSEYANLTPRQGSAGTPPRLLSDIGFQVSVQVSYLNAHPAHVLPPEDEEPRTIRQLVVCAYGLELDRARILSRRNRTVRTRRGSETGMAPHPENDAVLVSAGLDARTHSVEKKRVTQTNMTTRGSGPAYHYLIDRLGNISIGPALDYQTAAVPDRSPDGVFIGLEGALGITRANFTSGNVRTYFELPYTDIQIDVLVVLLAKLYTAFSEIPRPFNNLAGLGTLATLYTAGSVIPENQLLNFSNGAWRQRADRSFDYYRTDNEPLSALIASEGAYNLATDVFRTSEAPRAVAAREEARVAIGQIDTAGRQSLALGAYLSLAAPERSSDMQGQSRRELFVLRERAAHSQAAQTGEQSGGLGRGSRELRRVEPLVSNFEPHVYDYDRGVWGDGRLY